MNKSIKAAAKKSSGMKIAEWLMIQQTDHDDVSVAIIKNYVGKGLYIGACIPTKTLADLSRKIDRAIKRKEQLLRNRDAELLRVRTTGHAAAHELDNIAIECGLGHSPKPGVVANHVRLLRKLLETSV